MTARKKYSRSPREVVSWKIYADLLICCAIGRSPREVVSWKKIIAGDDVMSFGRSPREVVSWKIKRATCRYYSRCRPPREVVSWKIKRATCRYYPRCRPPREVVSWKMYSVMSSFLSISSTSTRGHELKMYYKMRVLKRILQTFLSYIHLYLRYTYRSWKTIKQK